MQNFISNPDTLLKQIWNDSNVNFVLIFIQQIHIVQKINYLNKRKFCLIDISINQLQQQNEEKIYLQSYFYRTNIRKGNTLVEVFNNMSNNKNKAKSKIQWGRKGTQKIMEIKLQYLQSITQEITLTNKDSKRSFDYVFRNVYKHFQNGKRVQLLKTQKANGQNVQISYFYELDSWLICSKNTSLMASNISDLQLYEGNRYVLVKEIAKQWFQEIKNLSKEKMKKLKTLLDGFTLLGQYCGNSLYQDIITYKQMNILWFALVDNFSQQYSLDPFEVKKNIQEFGFKFVKVKRCGSFNDKKLFFKALQELYLKTAQSGIEDQQYGMQGSIVYFVAPQMKEGQLNTKVLGAGSLKTIQNRIFRRIRQLMKLHINKNANKKHNQTQFFKTFYQECILLEKSNKRRSPYPIQYYVNLLKNGLNFVKTCKISQENLMSKFILILKIVLYSLHKNISLQKNGLKLFQNQRLINQIHKISFEYFGALNCNQKIIYIPISLPQIQINQLNNALNQHLNRLNLSFNLIKSSNQNKKLQLSELFNKINDNFPQNQSPFLQYYYIKQSLKCQQIIELYDQIKLNARQNVYHKFILITDKKIENSQFFEQNSNKYLFNVQSIIFSYYLVYKKYYNTPTIQQKITELQKVTKQIEKRRNFQENNNLIKKLKYKYQVPFSKNVTINKQNLIECKQIIEKILAGVGDKQFQTYCRLILKLDKIHKNTERNKLQALTLEQVNRQMQNLIKNSFQQVPSFQHLF